MSGDENWFVINVEPFTFTSKADAIRHAEALAKSNHYPTPSTYAVCRVHERVTTRVVLQTTEAK